jgi:hypothetical protein
VIPFTLHFFYHPYKVSLRALSQNLMIMYCLLVMIFYMLQYKVHADRALISVLMLGVLGFLASYFLQQTPWNYHLLPAFQLSVILNAVLVTHLLIQKKIKKTTYIATILFSIGIPIYLVLQSTSVWIIFYFSSLLFFGGAVLINSSEKVRYGFLVVFSVLSFSFPFYYIVQSYRGYAQFQINNQKLITFLQRHAFHQSVSYFANPARYAITAIESAGAFISMRTEDMGWIPGVLHNTNSIQAAQDKTFLINTISADLNKNRPLLVLVDTKRHKEYIQDEKFDYINYFSNNIEFRAAWKSYRYFATINAEPLYKFDVYKHILRRPAASRQDPERVSAKRIRS